MTQWNVLAVAATLLLLPVVALSASRKPNVLIIVTDDQGSIDMNCYGSRDLVTPNMDAIAAAGTRFTQFESASPICSPSRAAILTGRNPARAGFPGPSSSSFRGGHGMPAGQVTLAEMYKPAGYATAHFGKWHLGYTPDEEPNAQGFAESFGFMSGCLDNYSHYFMWVGPNEHDLWHNGVEVWPDGQFLPDLCAAHCTDFMQQHRDEPFLIYFALNQPHYPEQGTAKWREYYKNLPTPRREYAEVISNDDEQIGKLLAKLDELHLRDDTIVCFQSDQGHSCEGGAYGGGGNAGPYRGAKFSLFEGGTRIPAMISWPGHLPEKQVRDQVVYGADWVPTLAELCDVKLPTDDQLDGRSMLPVVKSADAPTAHPILYWQTENAEWSVRDGSWKLIGNPIDPPHKGPLPAADKKLFLSDLAHDIGEQHNAAQDHPETVARLLKMRKEWAAKVNQVPVREDRVEGAALDPSE